MQIFGKDHFVVKSIVLAALACGNKFTRSQERGCGFVLRKFQQALAVLFSALKIVSSLLPSLVPSPKGLHFAVGAWSLELQLGTRRFKGQDIQSLTQVPDSYFEVRSLETWNK